MMQTVINKFASADARKWVIFVSLFFIFIHSTDNVSAQCTPTVSLAGSTNCVGAMLTVTSSKTPAVIKWQRTGTTVSTVTATWSTAGTTVAGTSGTSGTGAAFLNLPQGIFVDGHDTVYVADADNNRVQKWAPGATLGITVAGNGTSGSGASNLNNPLGVYVDASGNVYVADFGNNRIQKWARGASSGTTVAGTGVAGAGTTKLKSPASVFLDASGDIYVGDQGNFRVQKFPSGSTSGTAATTVAGTSGTSGSTTALLSTIYGIYVDASSNLYIADYGNNRVQKWASGASSGTTVAGNGTSGSGVSQLTSPPAVYVDGNSNVYVSDYGNDRIQLWVPGATSGTTVVSTAGAPNGIWIDSTGNMYVSDVSNERVQKFTANSPAVYSFASTGTYDAIVYSFSGCSVTTNTVTISAAPSVSLTSSSSCVKSVLTASATGTYTSIAWQINGNTVPNAAATWQANATTAAGTSGDNGVTAALLSNPADVFVDSHDTVYIADFTNNRIQKWAPGATSGTTVAGQSGGAAGSDSAHLNAPTGVYVDAGGNVYVADYYNNRVQKWARGASYGVTVAGGNGDGYGANQLSAPYGVFLDAGGDLYVSENGGECVSEWAPGATTKTIVAGAGHGNSGSAENFLNLPCAITVTADNSLYVGDYNNNRVLKFPPGSDSATHGITIAGGNGAGSAANQFSGPVSYVDNAGIIYAVDLANNRVQRWRPGSTSGTTIAGTGVAGSAANQLSGPQSIWVDATGNLFVSDFNNSRVQKFSINTSTNTTDTAFVGGNYTAIITNAAGCSSTSNTVTIGATPAIAPDADPTTCSGASALLPYTGTNSPTSYSITWGAAAIAAGFSNVTSAALPAGNITVPVPSAVPASTYSAVVTENNSSCPSSLPIAFAVTVNPLPTVNSITGSAGICLNATDTLSDATTGGTWSSNNAAVSSISGTGTLTGVSAGSVTVTYTTAPNSNGCINSTTTGPLTIYALPSVSITGSSACAGGLLTVSTNDTPSTITWQLGGSTVSTTNASWNTSATTVAGVTGTTGTGASYLDGPSMIYMYKNDTLYISDAVNNRVQKWAPGASSGVTVAGQSGGTSGSDASHLNTPTGVWVDANGNVYVADQANARVQKWARGATSGTTVAGTGTAGSAASQLSSPEALYVDASGNIYVSDYGNNRVQEFPSGSVSGTSATTVAGSSAGTSGSTSALLNTPMGIFVDNAGNVYVADRGNNRVQKWAPGASTGTTVAGTGTAGFGATELNAPNGIFVDRNSNLYIADANNSRIEMLAPGSLSGTQIAGGGHPRIG